MLGMLLSPSFMMAGALARSLARLLEVFSGFTCYFKYGATTKLSETVEISS
jgi:hypothetical protein